MLGDKGFLLARNRLYRRRSKLSLGENTGSGILVLMARNASLWIVPFVARIPLFCARFFPREKSRGLPRQSVTVPPASVTIMLPAA